MNEKRAESGVAAARYAEGALYGLGAVAVWATWNSVTRLDVKGALSAYDLAMLRFAVAGLLLLPVVLRKGLGLERLGVARFVILLCGAGAPFVLVAASGLRLAPASHAGALLQGAMPLFVALLSALLMKERLTASRKAGYGLIAVGVAIIVGPTAVALDEAQTIGHLLLLLAGFMLACYAIVLRARGIDALHGAALAATGSLVFYLPAYFAVHGPRGLDAPLADIAVQIVLQGVLVSIVALFFFGRGVEILGASAGAAFAALTPPVGALLAIPILSEIPGPFEIVALLLVSAGVFLASGGPRPGGDQRAAGVP